MTSSGALRATPREIAVIAEALGLGAAEALPSERAEEAARTREELAGAEPDAGTGREERIAVAAYFRAERRGFTPGHALEDWLAAEAEIDAADGAAR